MLKRILLSAFLAATLVLPGIASAGIFDTGLSDAGQTAYGTTAQTDPALVVGGIIKVFLGVLGVIFLLLITYAGFLWMTAAGNDSQVKKAKEIMVTSVVGLIILLSAYAISDFIIKRLAEATGTT